MKYRTPGQAKSVSELQEQLSAIDPTFLASDELQGASGPLGQPFQVGSLSAGNRFAIHPMEGWDATESGEPTEATLRRWSRFGASGAKLVWGGEAFAVRPEARAHEKQLCLHPAGDPRAGLEGLLGSLKNAHPGGTDDLVVGLQLTHSGRLSVTRRVITHDPVLDAHMGIDPEAEPYSDGELDDLCADFVRAAKLAQEVGFNFVDVKCCHGYLLHELLSAYERPGPHGGSLENRSRLLLTILAAIRSECPGLELGVRLSAASVAPYRPDEETGAGQPVANAPRTFGASTTDPTHYDLTEPRALLKMLEGAGVRLINVTCGSAYTCPHLQRPAAFPPSDGYGPPVDPLQNVFDHLSVVRELKASSPGLGFIGTGYSYLMQWLAHVGQHEVGSGHVDFVGLGRMTLAYPEFPRDVLESHAVESKRVCRTFSDCTNGPRAGLRSGCYPLDGYYRGGDEQRSLEEYKRSRGVRRFTRGQ